MFYRYGFLIILTLLSCVARRAYPLRYGAQRNGEALRRVARDLRTQLFQPGSAFLSIGMTKLAQIALCFQVRNRIPKLILHVLNGYSLWLSFKLVQNRVFVLSVQHIVDWCH